MDNTLQGYLYVIAAALMWGTSGTAGKHLLNEGISPFDIAKVRLSVASILLLVIFAVRRKELFRVRITDVPYFILLGGVFLALTQVANFFAISRIQVAAAIFLQYLSPILVAGFSIVFWNERLSILKASCLFLAFGGCYLMVGGYNLRLLEINLAGIGGGVLAALGIAGYTLMAERGMHRYSPWTVTFYAFVFASVSVHLVYPQFNYLAAIDTPHQAFLLLYISVAGTLLGWGCYIVGINYIRSTRAIITATLEPISAGILAYFLLGENLSLAQLGGAFLVILAIVLLQHQRELDMRAPDVLRAAAGVTIGGQGSLSEEELE